MQLTYRYRVKDKHAARLNAQARAVNFVWNFVNETQRKAVMSRRRWLSGFDLMRLTAGATKCGLDLHAHTVQRVCRQYDASRKQHKKAWLRWRGRKSLGWVPFNTGHVSHDGIAFTFRGERYDVWLHRPLPNGVDLGAGSFNQDAKGRWYLSVPVEVAVLHRSGDGEIGVDLGLTTLATCSDGEKIEHPRSYRLSEQRLAGAQRAKHRRQVRSIHAKARNQRADWLHKASARLAKHNELIVVGDVRPANLARTTMAKSVLDAGWSTFRNQLSYKANRHGGRYVEVREAWTTQTCSQCGSIEGPKGFAGLRERMWSCSCGAVHDRDVNAALNICAIGRNRLVGGAHV